MTISGVIDLCLARRCLGAEVTGVTGGHAFDAAVGGTIVGRRLGRGIEGATGRGGGTVLEGAIRDAAPVHGS